jgi:hypothetical protein
LNQTAASALQWTETRQDTGFVHSDSVNPENITLSSAGSYVVHISVPYTGDTAQQAVLGRVYLNGTQVSGGIFAQGYIQSVANEADGDGSIHWSGVVVSTSSNQILTVTTEREAAAGSTTVNTGFVGTIYIEQVATADAIVLRGRSPGGATDWSDTPAETIAWDTQIVYSTSTFTHSTSSNADDIIVDGAGDYLLTYNDAMTSATARSSNRITVQVDGITVSGAQTKSHYLRNQSGHNNSSGALVFLLAGLTAGQTINIYTEQEGNAATIDDTADAILTLTKKATLNLRPSEPTMYDVPFDNIRFASTTPHFDFISADPDGVFDLQYQFSISTTSDFFASTTRTSGTDSGFSNTASSTDSSPFLENNKIRFQLQASDILSDLTTYYWRVRAKDINGSGEYGDWSTTQSLTVDVAATVPNWYQTFDGQFESDTLVGTVSSGNDRIQVDATVSSDILLVYGEGTVTTPRYRIWNGVSWSVEGSAVAVSSTINWVATAAGVSRDEYALVTLDQSNDAYAQIYNASSSSWGNQKLLSSVVSSNAYRGVAVAYESLSGDVMAVSCTNSPDPVYSIWNGTSWSATSTVNASSVNNCNFLAIASDPASDEIILVVRDTGTQYEALVWNGSSWVDSRVIGSSALVASEGMSVAYESSGDEAVIVVSNNTGNNIFYTTWNGAEWSANTTQTIGNDFVFGHLSADPGSDNLVLCYIDADVDVGQLRWDGGVWSSYLPELTGTGNAATGRPVDCDFETVAGRAGYIMAAYGDTGVDGDYHQTFATSTWSGALAGSNINDAFWVQTERAGDGTIVGVHLDDENDRLDVTEWNGTSWSNLTTLETSPSSVIAVPYEMFSLSAKRFQFTEGVVETPEIDFTFVASQPTWGDISFSTTEPFGTDVLVRVRYTATTTCDAYIPDGVLAGNSTGFDESDAPIVLTNLSTSTYDQICLEATITTLGSASASLDDWTLSWVREPKLIQYAYRWYANGSFLTPTDPWPAGGTDLAENTAVNSTDSVNVTDVVRLRLSLRGSNVTLPVETEIFKLQYAEGFSCSPTLNWFDVGDSASTTALWRGYENSIVGDDWLSANWGKRISITVDASLVPGDQTNFPVYVNLDDLPDSFFTGVQSDGDDIRVTSGDGITELPYELVSINGSAKTGELHFKASLSSTTDSLFYLYYGNATTSGYAVSATYGRNNVWTNGFLTVYHLDQSPTSSAPQFIDSTGNFTGTATNLEYSDRQTSLVGRGLALDGSNEYVDTNFNQNILTSTWSIWMYASGTQGAYDGILMSRGTLTHGINVNSGTTRLGYHWRDAANTYGWNGAPLLPTNQWSMTSLVVEPTQATVYSYSAGIGTSSVNAVTHATATVDALDIGQDPFGGRLFTGLVDEVSLSNVARSATWLSTTYNNKSNATGFYDVSSEELIGDGRTLPSTVLTDSDYTETYEEANPTSPNRNVLPVDDDAEWDFSIENNAALVDTNYCFRLVYEDGATLNTYTTYPRLITNAPPPAPDLSAPFDNEQLASTTPWFEFAATDEAGDEVSYEIEIDNNYDFSSPALNRNSVDHFTLFTNILNPSERSQYTSGQTLRFIPNTALSNNTTYWWRVRARDDFGSNNFGDWSTPESFTVATATTITTWFQTTGEQFETDSLIDALSSTSTNDIGINTSFTIATTTSSVIDYDDRDTGNAWGVLSWTDNESSGTVDYYVEYRISGETFALIPDADLPGNSSGFNTSPISLIDLDTATYNELRLRAVFSGNATLPRLLDWTVIWGETIEIPTHLSPFDNAKVATTTPSFTFFTTDPENNDLQYEFQLSSSFAFTSSSTFVSGVNAGFSNTASTTDVSAFISGDTIQYTAQSALGNGSTYWWRVRARDPGGSDTWSDYSDPHSFTIDTSITVSVWHQTTGEQFETDTLGDIETTAGTAQITSTVDEVLMAYGEGTGQAPRYRIWDGTAWGTAGTADSVGAQIRWTQLRAAPTRPEYALGTLGTDADVNVQIYQTETDTWGNVSELETAITDTQQRGFDLAYETTSGDLVAVSCHGLDAVYSVWNGTSWSATSSISLANANNCLYVEIVSDPTSDELIAVFKHTNTSAIDYETLVWNGSSWGNASAFGDMVENANAGIGVQYEESGGQAMVALSNGALATLVYNIWNGSAWAGTTTTALGDHIEWAGLKRDQGTDEMALCYVDNDTNIGVIQWTGSAWSAFAEIEAIANSKAGQAIDCVYETLGARDGYLLAPYSDNGAAGAGDGGKYQVAATSSFAGELDLDTFEDSWRVITVRGGDGMIHTAFFDDTNDRYDVSQWNGTAWTTRQTISSNPSITGTPFDGSLTMVAQIYPNYTSGSIRSTPIDFSDGTGPRWEEITFADTTPGASVIEYHLYYLASTSVYTLVPDSALPGNNAGFTTSPIDISTLDRSVYETLALDAQFVCVSGTCPALNDWSVEWSEGITVSGRAYEFNGTATTTSGSVAVAVNGVLEVGKTGTIAANGTWSITNVTAFEGDSVVVFVNGAADVDEAIAVTTYDGIGDVINMELTKRHLTVGSSDTATTTNNSFIGYDNSDDEDLFFTLNGSGVLTVCAEATCADGRLKVKSASVYEPGANIVTHDFSNFGTFRPASTTLRISGSFNQQGTFTEDTSTMLFTATSGAETLTATGTAYSFYNVTFGEATSTAIWTLNKPLDVNGILALDKGTLARGTSSITVAGDLRVGSGGNLSGLGTTTFDGSSSHIWSDLSASSTNIGYVVIDGTTKTVTLGSNVTAGTVTIGSDDTLNASGSGFNINVLQAWNNYNAFIPQAGTVTFTGTSTGTINRGTSAFNNLTFSGVGGSWSFSTSTLAVNGNLTIATGTVTLPTGTTTIAGSFLNTGGTFAHNNGEVRMSSTAAGKSIMQRSTVFLNAFYDLVFTGSGAWSFTEASATTTRHFKIQSGTVTLASSTVTVGGDFIVTGSGAFVHNNGELILLVQDANTLQTNGSSLYNVRTRAGTGSWYNAAWLKRLLVTIDKNKVQENLTDFPVYVNLSNLPDAFFSSVQADGDDIRITSADGMSELPFELVSIDTAAKTGELHFKTTLSSTTDTQFYIYYNNTIAPGYSATSTYGRNNVWSNGFAAVYHLDQSPTAGAPQYIDSTGSTTGTAVNMEVGDRQAGAVGQAQNIDGTNEYITTTFNSTLATSTWSLWMRANGTQGAYDGLVFSRGGVTTGLGFNSGGTNLGYHWNDTVATYGWVGGPVAPLNDWFMASLVVAGSQATVYAHASSGVTSGSNTTTHGNSLINNLQFGQDSAGGRLFNGLIDEIRIATLARTSGWLGTEYNNKASSTTFYAVGVPQSAFTRTYTDTNATIVGNLILDTGGDSTFPSGILSVGGSFDNNAVFTHSSGTVRFNSTAGSETIAAGSSTFATIDFSGVGGNFTVTENATASVAFNLTTATQFSVASSVQVTAAGTFSNAVNGASTTWTGSTLIVSGTDQTINTKTSTGDSYGTLTTTGDTDISLWNSSASVYRTDNTSSVYSQDHAGIDGDLYIFGDYMRTTGTEYWSYATDFDSTSLTGSTSRQVDVRIASSSYIGFTNASLNLVGLSSASTTIASQSGAFTLVATNTTVTAEHFTTAGTGVGGFGLLASSTLATFRDGYFSVVPGQTGITLSSSTITKNASAQLYRISFATTTPGSASNVTVTGTTSSFVWFRSGGGNLYGEAYDSGDGNPGSVRFDDSSNSITVAGTVYADDGITLLGAPTCNSTTPNVRIVIDGGTYSASTTCSAADGSYSFTNVNYIGDPKVIVYLDTNGGVQGSAVSKTLTGNVSNMNIYANRVIVRHEDTAPLTLADMTLFDNDNDSDVRFTAATSSLLVQPNTELFIFASSTFAPGGSVTLLGNGNNNSYEGTLQLGAAATFTATGTETHTLAGRLVLATTSTLFVASSTFVFNATTSGKSITSPNTISFNEVQFAGVGGGWNLTAPLLVLANMSISTGTVTGTNNITVSNGSLSGNGVLSLGLGTTTINRSNTLGGTSPWTFANLVLGSGSVVGTTTPNTSATTTILGRLTISNAHILDANATVWDLAGTGVVFTETGTLLEDTSTFRYSGSSASILSTTYYNLDLNSGAGAATYTATGLGITALNNLSVGGTATTTFNVTTNDPTLIVGGDVLIQSNGTLIGSNSASFTVGDDWDVLGTFTSSDGTVTFGGSGSSTIAAGGSNFGALTINGTGTFSVTADATTTGALTLTNHAHFTVDSGRSLAIGGVFTNSLGGGATTWTGSTLSLYGGGTKTINASTTSDVYGTLAVAALTNVRMWNSSASSYAATGGIYSQDHAGSDGSLYIYGVFTATSSNDYWSYNRDFDGTPLTASTSRPVNVAFASGASVNYNGGSLELSGTSTASTSLTNQGSGTYGLAIGATASTTWNYVTIRDINSSGVVLSGTPTVNNFSHTDHLVKINSATAVTVGSTVINANEALSFSGNKFEADSGVTGASNVTATGTAVSSWRFTNHSGNSAGEGFDVDPAGDPGYITWDDSAALITISGVVYSDEGSTLSTICDGSTNNIRLVVANTITDTTYNTTCSATSSAYSISNVAYSPLDTLVVYIVGETEKATTVSTEPISSIGNMHLYENRVIVRHESTNPLSIERMSVWDSSDDTDIQFTAIDSSPDTLTLPANRKLLIWSGKTFEPAGNVTVSGGGAGAAYDGTLEAQTNAVFRALGSETHTVGGSFNFGTGAVFTAGQSTTTFTTTGSARTIDVNNASFYTVSFTGAGSWTVTDSTFTTSRGLAQTAGTITFGSATTTIGSNFNATGGAFTMPGSALVFVSTTTGNVVRFDDSVVPSLRFSGTGGAWSMTDTNATSSGSFTVASGTVTLPTGNLAVARNFENTGGTIVHNTADLIMTATSTANLSASSSSLFAVRFAAPGPFIISDVNVTLLDSFIVSSGTVTLATGTLSVGGSFDATGGVLNHSSGTVLFNATSVGKTVAFGQNSLYDVVFGSGSGGWTLSGNATTTHNFSLTAASSFTKDAATQLNIGGVFTNLVGGAATTWTNSTLRLYSGTSYTINTKTLGGDAYGTLSVGIGTDIRSWNSSAATSTLPTNTSWYSQLLISTEISPLPPRQNIGATLRILTAWLSPD